MCAGISMQFAHQDVEFEMSLRPDTDTGHEGYLLFFAGQARVWDDDAAEERAIARIGGLRLDLAAARADEVNLHDLLDSASQHLSEFNDEIVHDHICELAAHASLPGEQLPCDCLVFIEQLEVEEPWRGKGIGTFLLKKLGEVMDLDDGLLALKAYPIVRHEDDIITAQDIERVHRFYERLGFQRFGTHFMVKDTRSCDTLRKRRMARPPVARRSEVG